MKSENVFQALKLIDAIYWEKLFKEINFDLIHFKANDIMSAFNQSEFTEINVVQFFEKHMQLGEDYINYTLHAIQGMLVSDNDSTPQFKPRNFINNMQDGHNDMATLNKILAMLQLCVNHIEKRKFNTRYLLDSAPHFTFVIRLVYLLLVALLIYLSY